MFFFFNDTATTEIYTLSLHDALPISPGAAHRVQRDCELSLADPFDTDRWEPENGVEMPLDGDRKSTRLNSSHSQISYAVFCLKKKRNTPVSQVCRRDRASTRRFRRPA